MHTVHTLIRQAPKTKGRGVPTVVALRAWEGDGWVGAGGGLR